MKQILFSLASRRESQDWILAFWNTPTGGLKGWLRGQVTTRRTQGAEKALVPTWNDSVSKLPGVGKETFNKLKDLRSAGLAYPLHDYRIATGDPSSQRSNWQELV